MLPFPFLVFVKKTRQELSKSTSPDFSISNGTHGGSLQLENKIKMVIMTLNVKCREILAYLYYNCSYSVRMDFSNGRVR